RLFAVLRIDQIDPDHAVEVVRNVFDAAEPAVLDCVAVDHGIPPNLRCPTPRAAAAPTPRRRRAGMVPPFPAALHLRRLPNMLERHREHTAAARVQKTDRALNSPDGDTRKATGGSMTTAHTDTTT